MTGLPGSRGRLRVVGIGCDGLDGLSVRARSVLDDAHRIIGAARQLDLLDVGSAAGADGGAAASRRGA